MTAATKHLVQGQKFGLEKYRTCLLPGSSVLDDPVVHVAVVAAPESLVHVEIDVAARESHELGVHDPARPNERGGLAV